MGVRTSMSIRILPEAANLSDFPAGVWHTAESGIHD